MGLDDGLIEDIEHQWLPQMRGFTYVSKDDQKLIAVLIAEIKRLRTVAKVADDLLGVAEKSATPDRAIRACRQYLGEALQ